MVQAPLRFNQGMKPSEAFSGATLVASLIYPDNTQAIVCYNNSNMAKGRANV